jgi:hypothetical protein
MAKKAISTEQMSAAQLATEACDQGFQQGVEKMVEILLQGWIIAQSPRQKHISIRRAERTELPFPGNRSPRQGGARSVP